MLTKLLSPTLIAALAVVSFVAKIGVSAQVTRAPDGEKVLHNFGRGKDGALPEAGLIFDAAGNMYGTTFWGGSYLCGYDNGCGTIFRLTPSSNGKWTEKVLYSFGSQGCEPAAALILDAAGNLYGTASGNDCDNGTVFRLAPGHNDIWTYSVLYSFKGGADGAEPVSSLIFDAAGNLYGTTAGGGEFGWGAAFELKPQAGGKWTEKVLHSFNPNAGDGSFPVAALIFDPAGNLYGTTWSGGFSGSSCDVYGCGTVFQLTSSANGNWKERVLHRFKDNGKDGHNPDAGLILDAGGNLYGTTGNGGRASCSGGYGCGTVFELMPGVNGNWTEKVLRSFQNNGSDGLYPEAGLTLDAVGNLYGTTSEGGISRYGCNTYGCGTAFVLKPNANGNWTEEVLHRFDNTANDGNFPATGVIFGRDGNLYGTTIAGGSVCTGNCGTVFKITQ